MKISLCNEVIATLSFEEQCKFIRATGYDGIEIAPFTLGDEPHKLSASTKNEVKKIAADYGVPITGLHYLMIAPKGLSITSSDKAVRERSTDVMRRLCDLAAELGAKLLVHGSPNQRLLEPGKEAEQTKYGIECFAKAAEAAAKNKVVYLLEPMSVKSTGFINTVEQAVKVVRDINSPGLSTMLDCSAAGHSETNPIPDVLKKWIPSGLIAHVHFNDPNRRGPGEGELAIAPIVQALRDAGYKGDAAIEPFIYEPDGPACAARGIGYLRGIMESQR